MKTKNFKFKTLALALLALVLSSNVWGETETIFSHDGSTCSPNTVNVTGNINSNNGNPKPSFGCTSSSNTTFTFTNISTTEYSNLTLSMDISFQYCSTTNTWPKVTITTYKNNVQVENKDIAAPTTKVSGYNNYKLSDLAQFDKFVITVSPAVGKSSAGNPTTTYNDYIDNIVLTGEAAPSCTNEITITKGTPSNGTFNLSQTGEVCIDEGNATVNVTDITPAEHYHFSQITATNGTVDNENKRVTDISTNTTINVEFAADTKYTISFLDNIQSEDVDDIEVYGGATFEFPDLDDRTATTEGTCEEVHYHFMGWVISTHTGDITDSDIKTGTSDAVSANATYKAVWAAEQE